jgi:biotin transporter BioY
MGVRFSNAAQVVLASHMLLAIALCGFYAMHQSLSVLARLPWHAWSFGFVPFFSWDLVFVWVASVAVWGCIS